MKAEPPLTPSVSFAHSSPLGEQWAPKFLPPRGSGPRSGPEGVNGGSADPLPGGGLIVGFVFRRPWPVRPVYSV